MKAIAPFEIKKKAEELSSPFDYKMKETAIILAAGHGKRIKSQKSKMLHSIWGIPTVERVCNACKIDSIGTNTIIVVGIKALDVMNVIGKREKTIFAYQQEQKGTGHAVQIALLNIDDKKYDGIVYVFPGDMGLLNKETVEIFRNEFAKSKSDMMVLTGIYEGDVKENNYGRIVRVKEFDINGTPSGKDFGNVIEIIEYKDILSIANDENYITIYNGRKYSYSKKELIENREFNSSVYAFKYKKLVELISKIKSNNAQNEIYITDLISLFNKKGYKVAAISPKDQYVVMGFNDKSVLREMENLYRQKVYDKIKNIIEIDDPDDFFIHENVVEEIISTDRNGTPLDIKIGKGVYIGNGVKLNYNLYLKKNVYVDGNVQFGKNVTVWENVLLSCFMNQEFIIGDNVEILWGDIIKGNIVIGDNSRIESSVNMTGSDDYPLRIGKNVLIKGTSYIFGSIIEDDIHIEHSVLIKKKILRTIKANGDVQSVKFIIPTPSGIDIIENLK
ncbi:MAG: multidrug transporter [Chlorobiaceae bacterium]|nr:multidrug transporter [Chlorobiaceae bacterium]MBA4309299.1 multidrug transporter [Chlorobiaceae bacterium]